MIKAILFDIGGVILNESELEKEYFKFAKDMLRQSDIKLKDEKFDKAVKQCILSFEPSFTRSLVQHFVKHDKKKCNKIVNAIRENVKNWSKNHPQKLNPGIKKILQLLSETYKLTLAGNQPSAVKNLLEQYGILKSFTTTDVSEDIGISKPDPRFFTDILKKLNVKGHEAIMIGDRLDNDIIPAKSLGMKTILVKVGIFAILEPRAPEEIPDATVSSVSELPPAIKSIVEQGE